MKGSKDGTPAEKAEEPEGSYNQKYYETHKDDLLKAARDRWHGDKEYRDRVLAAAKEERAAVRASKALEKFNAMVARVRDENEAAKAEQKRPKRRPYGLRKVSLTGKPADLHEVYPSGTFGEAIGRKGETIRDWLAAGVLPGASVFFGEGIGRKAYFTEGFIRAVHAACERLYFIDGNGRLDVLRVLVHEELARAKESFVTTTDPTTRRTIRQDDVPPFPDEVRQRIEMLERVAQADDAKRGRKPRASAV